MGRRVSSGGRVRAKADLLYIHDAFPGSFPDMGSIIIHRTMEESVEGDVDGACLGVSFEREGERERERERKREREREREWGEDL